MTTSTRRLPSGDTITYDSEDGSRIWRRKDGTTWRSVHYGPWQRVDKLGARDCLDALGIRELHHARTVWAERTGCAA